MCEYSCASTKASVLSEMLNFNTRSLVIVTAKAHWRYSFITIPRLLNYKTMRLLPNIIITGTPGVGKTSHCESLVQNDNELKHLSINKVVKERGCHSGWDEEYKSWIVDEDKVSFVIRSRFPHMARQTHIER